MMEPLVHMEAVSRVFVTDEVETHALAGIDLEIQRGEYVSISGPSGCGKSTLLAILGLLDYPTDGSYVLNGRPVQDLKLSERAGDFVDLRAADRRVEHLDQNLADAEFCRQRNLIDDEWLARFRQNRCLRCLHFHRRSLSYSK